MVTRPMLHSINKRGSKGKPSKKEEKRRNSRKFKDLVQRGLRK